MSDPKSNHADLRATKDWVLVVDDDEPIHGLIITALTADDLEVVAAFSGAEALKIVEQRATEPVLVLTDVLMPGMDGLTLARKLNSRLKRSKIAVMSGHLADVSWWPADLRDLAFMTKPFRLAELMALVEAARHEFRSRP